MPQEMAVCSIILCIYLGPREARCGSYRMCQARPPLPILLSTGTSCSLLTYRYPLSRTLTLRRPVGGEIDCRVRPAVVEIVHAAEVEASLRDERFRSPPVSNTSQTLTRWLMEVIGCTPVRNEA
jgi:hypothetical protein